MLEGVALERERLAPLRARATRVVDTTRLSVHELRRAIIAQYNPEATATRMAIRVVSFGFKYGPPVDSDLVFDVRFLENPYFVPALKSLPGTDPMVRDFVLAQDGAAEWLDRYEGLLRLVFDGYAREGQRYALAAVGCTGGKHRSVAMSEQLAGRRAGEGVDVSVVHRDLGRE